MMAIYPLAHSAKLRHTAFACKTKQAGFGSPNVLRRTTATRRYFYVHTHLRTFFGRAIAGAPSGAPVSLDAGLPTLLSARPPHLEVGSGPNRSKEVAMRANTLARSEQTLSPEVSPFDAGVQAAHAWFEGVKVSAATYRDNARCNLVRPIVDDSEAALASTVFNRGFAHGLALVIAGVRHA